MFIQLEHDDAVVANFETEDPIYNTASVIMIKNPPYTFRYSGFQPDRITFSSYSNSGVIQVDSMEDLP